MPTEYQIKDQYTVQPEIGKQGMFPAAFSSLGGSVAQPGNVTTAACIGAVLGGTAETIGGGKFANGAVTGAFTVLFNDYLHSPAEEAGNSPQSNRNWDLNNDGKLQKNEADSWWLKGKGNISVDNSKINWSGLKIPASAKVGHIFSINTTQAFLELPYETAATYGGTSFLLVGPSTVKVIDQLYHYQYRPNNSVENVAMNIMNWIGKPSGEGTDYMVHYINPYIHIK